MADDDDDLDRNTMNDWSSSSWP
ncbi:unnamed protein product, partial [Rotaria magnacalcarata]